MCSLQVVGWCCSCVSLAEEDDRRRCELWVGVVRVCLLRRRMIVGDARGNYAGDLYYGPYFEKSGKVTMNIFTYGFEIIGC
ncbi:unnamed protein product [Heterobilharzia americana]|nr:unnamed protein product [Heterobilharzia americana]